MAAPNFYLGNVGDLASNMGSMFGGDRVQGMNPIRSTATMPAQSSAPSGGMTTGSTSGPYGGTFNPLASQAIRPTSFGNFDPSYGQNLATSIGSSFQRPQANQALQFNPYGNLTDANVPYPNSGGLPGLPQTLLQWAQIFNPTALGTNLPKQHVSHIPKDTGGGGR